MTDLAFTELPERAAAEIKGFAPSREAMAEHASRFANVTPREPDASGATEVLDGVTFTHRHREAPGDYQTINWHYVECGEGEPIVFLHGIPDSWYQWYHQMAALSDTHRCIAIDLKGYGQSYTGPGDYRHEGAAHQLVALLDEIGVTKFNLVSHDRGTAQADFIAADFPDRVLRYGRGEQHLYHFNPLLTPQSAVLRDAPYNGILSDPASFVVGAYASLARKPVPDADLERLIQEFSHPGVARAVPRYYASTSMHQEWLIRRERLLAAWTCPVLLIQGYDTRTQPREFYEGARGYIPNAADVQLRLISGGHYWPFESPEETTDALRHLLTM